MSDPYSALRDHYDQTHELLAEALTEIDRLRADLDAAREREGKLRSLLWRMVYGPLTDAHKMTTINVDRGDWERARALLAEEGKP